MRSIGYEPETAGFTPVRASRLAMHPLLVIVPSIALLLAVVLDTMYLVSGAGAWARLATGLLVIGLFVSLPAAAIGLLDWTHVPTGTRAKSLATWHGLTSGIALVLFTAGLLARVGSPSNPGVVSLLLVWSGAGLLVLGGVLGGELASRLCVPIRDGEPDEAIAPPVAVPIIGPAATASDDRQIARA